MTEYGTTGGARRNDAAFVDGVIDTYERVAAIHDGPRVTKRGAMVELTPSTTLSRSPSVAMFTR